MSDNKFPDRTPQSVAANMTSGFFRSADYLMRLGRRPSAEAIIDLFWKNPSTPEEIEAIRSLAVEERNYFLLEKLSAKSGEFCSSQEALELRGQISDFIVSRFQADLSAESAIKIRGFGDCSQILFADIDINTVDGSAIWFSSMAHILSAAGKTIVVSKNPIRRSATIGQIHGLNNLLFLTPRNFGRGDGLMSVAECVEEIKGLDNVLVNLQRIVVRGVAVANEILKDRQFYQRVYAYLTDIYAHTEQGIELRPEAAETVDMVARQGAGFLIQTKQLEKMMRQMTCVPLKAIELPPPVPDTVISRDAEVSQSVESERPIRIGYAGKIAPNWGVLELLDWMKKLKADGIETELTFIGDKISGGATPEENKALRLQIFSTFEELNVKRTGALERAAVLEEMKKVDFAWCWRPASFEEHTLEISSKLLEGVISGQRCITFPSQINREAFGDDYPFFIRDYEDLRGLLVSELEQISFDLRAQLLEKHAVSNVAERIEKQWASAKPASFHQRPHVVVASHDSKFLHPIISELKLKGIPVSIDSWNWGDATQVDVSKKYAEEADVVFCEWGLANAVWYSKNLPAGKKLIIRIHAQEVRPKAAKFGRAMNHDRVDSYVFVSERVRNKAIELFGIQRKKTKVIPNFVLDSEYQYMKKDFSGPIRLGMVGIIPTLKRFDRAVIILEKLLEQGRNATLSIKGPRPETIPYMLVGARSEEMPYYYDIYEKIEASPKLKQRVTFEKWGNNVAKYYEGVDHILSTSDTESFHYALADGVLSGCHPVVFPWASSDDVYPSNWIVSDEASAVASILRFRDMSQARKNAQAIENRNILVERYGFQKVFGELLSEILS